MRRAGRSGGRSRAIQAILSGFLAESNARTALIVDRTGQLVATVGESPEFDPTAFATLTAADFSANDQLAKLIGENDFNSLFHQGEQESMYLADIARRVILVVLFDNRTTLGLVRLKMQADRRGADPDVRPHVRPQRGQRGPHAPRHSRRRGRRNRQAVPSKGTRPCR